jgi:protein-S-isoprenylcysteine O-methyltransferase Ste14
MPEFRPLILVWPEALAFWLAFAWLYAMEARQLQRRLKISGGYSGDDKYSGLVISVGSTILQLAAFALAFYQPSSVPEDQRQAYFWAGLAITCSGTLLRVQCWAALGKFFTHTVTIAGDHQVINNGPYRFVRHPSYAGALLNLIGLGITLGNFGSIAVITIGSAIIYTYRISVEEAALEAALGDKYRQFKLTRKRLIPYVF